MKKIITQLYFILPTVIQSFWKKIENSEIASRLANGAFWSLTGSLVSQGLMIVASIVVARILGKLEYGELGMVRSTVNMFSIFAGFGLGLTATKYIAEFRTRDTEKTAKIIGLTTIFAVVTGGIIAIAILISAPFLAEKTINAPHLVREIRLGAVILFLSALNGAFTGILAGFEAFKSIAKINLIVGIIGFPLQIGLTFLFGLQGSVIGFGLNFLILCIFNFITVRKFASKFGIKIKFKKSFSEWPILYKFSLPALLSGLMVSPIIWACNAIMVNQPHGYSDLAIFDAASQWRGAILFVPVSLSQIILPLLSDSENQHQFDRIIKINILINFLISLLMAILVSFFSSFIMKSYGNDFEEGQLVLVVLAFSAVFISINNVIGQAIASKGEMWIGFLFNSIWGITLLICSYIFLKLGYGANGLAYSFLISYLVHTLVQVTYANKYLIKKVQAF